LGREEEERVRGNQAIAAMTGRKPRGYRLPSWDLSPHSVDLLLKDGFAYDSSMIGHDYLPYPARNGDQVPLLKKMIFGADTKLVEMPISWSLDDHPDFEFFRGGHVVMAGLQNARGVFHNWLDEFAYFKKHQE
jgi:peptidoglycan/xylan/chitin deacetylase (PgdA/CDA1 family)